MHFLVVIHNYLFTQLNFIPLNFSGLSLYISSNKGSSDINYLLYKNIKCNFIPLIIWNYLKGNIDLPIQ